MSKSKFKLKMKLQGFELEIEGDRADVPHIAQSVGQHIAGMIQGPAALADENERPVKDLNAPPVIEQTYSPKPSRGLKKRSAGVGGGRVKVEAVDWRHEPERWGNPQIAWSTADKAIWLLHVAEQAASLKEFSAGVIAATFNKHFKQARIIQASKVTRDLGQLKTKREPMVGELTTRNPPCWFLTEYGKKKAESLVEQATSGRVSA